MSYKGFTMNDVINNASLQAFQADFQNEASGTLIQSCTLPFAVEVLCLFLQIENIANTQGKNMIPMNLRNQLMEYFQMCWGINNSGSPNVEIAFAEISVAFDRRYNV
jgi:hypothetical protein